jgi:hypothetical protein
MINDFFTYNGQIYKTGDRIICDVARIYHIRNAKIYVCSKEEMHIYWDAANFWTVVIYVQYQIYLDITKLLLLLY